MAQTSSSLPGHQHGHSFGHGHGNHGHAKITKPRSRPAVKPILKKLQSHHSHSEKNSLDLDRGWDEQGPFGYSSYNVDGDDSSYTAGASALPTPAARARDVSFSISATDLSTGGARSNKYSHGHARSTSGTSHASIATSASGGRNGSFVHPFQQTPRTSTPPLSYANSLASLENTTGPRDYSPTITENEDNIDSQSFQASTRAYHSGSRPRRPSLASQRTSSLSDVNQPQRITASGVSARKPHRIVTRSRSDLHLNTGSTTAIDSASSTSPPSGSFISPQMIAASTSSNAMSPLRSSLDMSGFRLRSRSEVDTATRQENVREARRKFEEKERAKEEKYAREQIRKQERAESREAHRFNKNGRKGSFGTSRISCDRVSSSTDIRPSISRKTTGNGVGLGLTTENEKVDFATRSYDTAPTGQTPGARADDVHFHSTHRANTTKRKTTSTWTAFVLWLRTRLLKLGRR
ncbi:hypothetical protein F53441_5890 [Fusarium austroafricanum]|uniref:Uncharacterized protein n=1 Tax=Fusarium austroafricanum TaxID=2364996 RepID=A0A8H4NZ70_9HYPO|nr:hypothetical protein F53441_5890 [Fusarium austroafricanum]